MSGHVHPSCAPPLILRVCRYGRAIQQLLYADRTIVATPRQTKVTTELFLRDAIRRNTLKPHFLRLLLRYPARSRKWLNHFSGGLITNTC